MYSFSCNAESQLLNEQKVAHVLLDIRLRNVQRSSGFAGLLFVAFSPVFDSNGLVVNKLCFTLFCN